MLLDGLVDNVYRQYHMKLLFEAGPVDGEVIFGFDLQVNEDSVANYADHPILKEKKAVTRDEFLAYKIVMPHQQESSVRDVIKLCANNMGGVHLDGEPSDSDHMKALVGLEQHAIVAGV